MNLEIIQKVLVLIITLIFLDTNKIMIMRKPSILLIFSFLIINIQVSAQKKELPLKISFEQYSVDNIQRSFITLKFEIYNNSNDTIYISSKNININVFRKNKILKSQKPSLGNNSISKSRIFDEMYNHFFEKKIKTETLRRKFAEKLLNKNPNIINEKYTKDYLINSLSEKCIIIFPNESVLYESLFINDFFENTLKVEAKFINEDIFWIYKDDKKEIVIKK
jgi:hypothetical protein